MRHIWIRRIVLAFAALALVAIALFAGLRG